AGSYNLSCFVYDDQSRSTFTSHESGTGTVNSIAGEHDFGNYSRDEESYSSMAWHEEGTADDGEYDLPCYLYDSNSSRDVTVQAGQNDADNEGDETGTASSALF